MNSFILDFDGTLVDLNDDPFAVTADADLLRLLEDMLLTTGGAVAICSGRSLENLQRFFRDLPLTLVGCHGAEFYNSKKNAIASDPGFLELAEVRPEIQIIAGKNPGLILEDKGLAVAVHNRATEEVWQKILDQIKKVISSKNAIDIFPGKRLIEIKAKKINKATAIKKIMSYQEFQGKNPVFFGDDHTDVVAIEYVNSIKGITGVVGNPSIMASHHFNSPAECRFWLSQYVVNN